MRSLSTTTKILSLSFLLGLSACSNDSSFDESLEVLYLTWQCKRIPPASETTGQYYMIVRVYGSGNLAGSLVNVDLSGGLAGSGVGYGRCSDIVKQAADLARGRGCVTRGIEQFEVGADSKGFRTTCQNQRSKLIDVMGELMRYAHTTTITP